MATKCMCHFFFIDKEHPITLKNTYHSLFLQGAGEAFLKIFFRIFADNKKAQVSCGIITEGWRA